MQMRAKMRRLCEFCPSWLRENLAVMPSIISKSASPEIPAVSATSEFPESITVMMLLLDSPTETLSKSSELENTSSWAEAETGNARNSIRKMENRYSLLLMGCLPYKVNLEDMHTLFAGNTAS